MANKKTGFIQPQVPIEVGGLIYRHLLPYAKARHQAPAEAINSILGDWAEGREGIRNPFAGAIPLMTQTAYTPSPLEEEDPEEDNDEALRIQEERIAKTGSLW